eukprot:Rmarinus@m.19227
MSAVVDFDGFDDEPEGSGFNDNELEAFEYHDDGIEELEGLDDILVPKTTRQEEVPVFSLDQVEQRFDVHGDILNASAGRDVVAMSTAHSRILRWNVATNDLPAFDFSKHGAIDKVFMDPSGNHCLVALESGDVYYLHAGVTKPKQLLKLKGVRVNTIAWCKCSDWHSYRDGTARGVEHTAYNVLVGTRDGQVYELSIIQRGKKDETVKLLYTFEDRQPVTGLAYDSMLNPARPEESLIVLATTLTCQYAFVGGPTMESLFNSVPRNPACVSLPSTVRVNALAAYMNPEEGCVHFAWLTEPGLYHGTCTLRGRNITIEGHDASPLITDKGLIQYPSSAGSDPKKAKKGSGDDSVARALAVAVTEFHFLVLFENSFQVINRLSKEVIFAEPFTATRVRGTPVGLTHDYGTDIVWLYTNRHLFKVDVYNEDCNAWRHYLDLSQFDMALHYCHNQQDRNKILTTHANYVFESRHYEEAAMLYAKCELPFEEVALKFVNQSEARALKQFLLHKLENLDERQSTQQTLICSWLVEIYLDELNAVALKGKDIEAVTTEFHVFLEDHQEHLDTQTTMDLIASHGRMDDYLFYAALKGEFEVVVFSHLQRGQVGDALRVIASENQPDLWYQFSPALMRVMPAATVDAWLKCKEMEPTKLLPALMNYDPSCNEIEGDTQNHAIRYLSTIVTRVCDDPAVHNYLVSLYAQEDDERPLLWYLESVNQEDPAFDTKYALRQCAKHGKKRACVQLYASMGLYEEAVNLALEVDVELAKDSANMPEDDEELKKKLWLRIARHVIEKENNVQRGIHLMTESCHVLVIDDILPFFPEFCKIDEFKEEIMQALEEYNNHIHDLKQSMDDATKSADLIRRDIKELRSRYGYVPCKEICRFCKGLLMQRRFYLFPCHHAFHVECLIKRVVPKLPLDQRMRLEELIGKREGGMGDVVDLVLGTAMGTRGAIPQNEVDEVVAGNCPQCGPMLVSEVDKPFIDGKDTFLSLEDNFGSVISGPAAG